MDYKKKWEKVKKIGEGGQGEVFKVIDLSKYDTKRIITEMISGIQMVNSAQYNIEKGKAKKTVEKNLNKYIQMVNNADYYALKVLHKPEDAVNPSSAKKRIKKEIEIMSKNLHKNLIKTEEYDNDEALWFTTKYYSKGTLSDNKKKYVGNVLESLKAIRPLVEAVSVLHNHEDKYVHRDIKPKNIFIKDDGDLVLGDFGLIYFEDNDHTRLTETMEDVGSSRWMPTWARHRRIEDVSPKFDVFCLGKVLWYMISKGEVLLDWYFNDNEYPQYNLENMFPGDQKIKLVNNLLKKCVVQYERHCLDNAEELLKEIDETIELLRSNADIISSDYQRMCKVCGKGHYVLAADKDNNSALSNYGFTGHVRYKVFTCNNCGNVQLFAFSGSKLPPAWKR